MDRYVAKRNGASRKGLDPLLTTVGNDLNAAKNVAGKVQAELDQWTNLHRAMTSYYTGSGAGVSELNWAINWEWNAGSVKRSEFENPIFRRQACERPTGTKTGESTGDPAGEPTGEPTDDGSATTTGSDDEDEDEPTQTPSASPADEDPTSTTSSEPPSQTCFYDQDCEGYECSSGDPFCAIAISKLRKRQEDPDNTDEEDNPFAERTGHCGCKNQDPEPEETATPTEPPPEGCTDGGTYDGFDECFNHCNSGFCNENAGQPQITCSCN